MSYRRFIHWGRTSRGRALGVRIGEQWFVFSWERISPPLKGRP